jgi:membrane protease YdiL (CAAX protease family)
MTDLPDDLEPLPPAVTVYRRRSWPVVVAWVVILGYVTINVVVQSERLGLTEWGTGSAKVGKTPLPIGRLGTGRSADVAVIAVGFAYLTLAVVGGLALLTLLAQFVHGRLRTWFAPGSPAGGVYAETFAVWLVLFVGLQYSTTLLPSGPTRLGAAGVAMLCSLTALVWPRLRGLSWPQVRREIGWTSGTQPNLEPVIGISCYIMTVPLIMIGGLLTLILIYLFRHLQGAGTGGPGGMPPITHPLAEAVLYMSWWGRLQIMVLACLVAPLVEETMFRGVLYRHLRETSVRWGRLVSPLISATLVSFLFAVVHPQGLLAVPALMGVAYGLNLAREWRDTLIPSMVAHGINNGVVFMLLLFLAGG